MQCSQHCAHQRVFSGWDRDKQEEEMSISDLKNPARSPAGKMGEVSRKWFSNESVPVARESPRTRHQQILEGKEKQVLARPDNQKLQLALNQALAPAGTEAVRAVFCGTLSAWHCLCLCTLERLSWRREDPLCLDHLPQPWGRRCKVPPAHCDLAVSPGRAQKSTSFSVGSSYFSQKRALV